MEEDLKEAEKEAIEYFVYELRGNIAVYQKVITIFKIKLRKFSADSLERMLNYAEKSNDSNKKDTMAGIIKEILKEKTS